LVLKLTKQKVVTHKDKNGNSMEIHFYLQCYFNARRCGRYYFIEKKEQEGVSKKVSLLMTAEKYLLRIKEGYKRS
jgi:hypothetical protein